MVTVPASVSGNHYEALVEKGLKPSMRIAELKRQGVQPQGALSDKDLGALIELEQKAGHEYWVGLQNFYVITRYNHSPLYAMAVYQLSEEIRALRDQRLARGAR